MDLYLKRSVGDDMILAGHNLPYDDAVNKIIDFTAREDSQRTMLVGNGEAGQVALASRTLAVVWSGFSD